MAFLKPRPDPAQLARMPSGSFTLDSKGRVLVSTMPRWFSASNVQEIGHAVLEAFAGAEKAQLPLSELVFNYEGVRLTARELRGGAIVFFSPIR